MSASLVGTIRGLFAIANVTAQVGPLFTVNRGFTSVVRTGVGDYLLTLQDGVNMSTEAQALCTLYGAAGNSNVVLAFPSLTTIAVRSFVAAVATDINFGIAIQDVGPS